jgi:tetratricopeptide (TPR) repeat protein
MCGPTKDGLNTEPGTDGTLAPLFKGLDVYNYRITTDSKKAQQYFDQGLMLTYGFNHAEASRSFREVIRQDKNCAMGYWGLAYVLGPNYNAPMDMEVLGIALDALASAKLNMHRATPKEQALISALSERYPRTVDEDPTPYYEAYADAMVTVHEQFPEDVDIAVMAAEALLNLHPWDLWTGDKEPKEWTPQILELLEKALAMDAHHPQATHMYIHSMEAGPDPEKAIYAADNLRLRVPGSGHLLHMPSHLYINTGHYAKGSEANELAVKEDSSYVEACHAAGIYPLIYYPHNWHFLAACEGLEGRGKRALEASRYMADYVVEKDLMREPDMITLQHFITIPWYIMIKFSMWDALLNEPKPGEDLDLPLAIWHYGRGMALAGKGDLEQAKKELNHVRSINTNEMADIMIYVNSVKDIINVAEYMLAGQIALKKGNISEAILLFEKSVEYEDKLAYIEPPDWFFSVRHYLGDALLKARRFADAEAVYRKDLTRYKQNGWALKGLQVSLENQGKRKLAQSTQSQFKLAWQNADVILESSVLSD